MYDINVDLVKSNNKTGYIFIAGGALFLLVLGGIFIVQTVFQQSLDAKTISTNIELELGTNSDGDTTYSPTYTYEVDEKTYTCKSTSSSTIMPSTENGVVYYDSKDPSKCVTEYSKTTSWWILAAMALPVICLGVGISFVSKSKAAVKRIAHLNECGKLVKNIPYKIEQTNTTVNGVQGERIVIDYAMPNGTVLTLKGDPRYDGKTSDSDGMVDLVIDENNPDMHFIDFEINRVSGNKPEDYYKDPYDMGQQDKPEAPTTPQTPEPAATPKPTTPETPTKPNIPPAINI